MTKESNGDEACNEALNNALTIADTDNTTLEHAVAQTC